MKISLGYNLTTKAWGGGNQFGLYLSDYLTNHGHKVVFDLADNDIDIILLVDPRWRSSCVSFGPHQVFRYILSHPSAIVVHRINECDERKNTKTLNRRLRLANYTADHTVCISKWLTTLKLFDRSNPCQRSIIYNGADHDVFYPSTNNIWNSREKLRLVTHHWSSHYQKGFDVYQSVDRLLEDPYWADRLEFTYIGNRPPVELSNTTVISPLAGPELAAELRTHHVYITASQNEPAGMHHIEAALSGLPLLYRNSGAIPEYCTEFGITYENNQYLPALQQMFTSYSQLKASMPQYPYTSELMCSSYLSLFEDLFRQKSSIQKNRKLGRSIPRAIISLIPIP